MGGGGGERKALEKGVKQGGKGRRKGPEGGAGGQGAVERLDWRNLARRAQRVFDNVGAGANEAVSGPAAATATPSLTAPGASQ